VPGAPGDPCHHRFREAVARGALPFCCQGPDNALTLQGGQTLGYELAWASETPLLDRIFIQVGGGALASACAQAFADARDAGALPRLPRLHAVQARGCSPLARAYARVAAWLQARLGGSAPEDEAARAAHLRDAVAADPGLLDEALRHAATHRASFMWPWEQEPRSAAHGILDDETYDWLAIVRGMLVSGGHPITVDEDAILRANALARSTTDIRVDRTGSAGLAGALSLLAQQPRAASERMAVLFTGVER
jgi:threonine synthase